MPVDWKEVGKQLDALYEASEQLEAIFPERKLTLDGHLVGSVGEVIAAFMFDLDLLPASTTGHDAKTRDCKKKVEIKITQGRSIGMRYEPQHLIVLLRPKGGPTTVVYNGPGKSPWNEAGKVAKNGQCPISIKKLVELNGKVRASNRLELVRKAPV